MKRTLPDLLDEFVSKAGQDIYLKSGKAKWSPSVFQRNVLSWAQFLSEIGVKPGDRVGIYLRKSLEEAGLIFAVAELGAIFVDIHPSMRFEQLRHIVQDCQIRILLSSSELLRALGSSLQSLGLSNLVVTDEADGLAFSGAVHKLRESEDLAGRQSPGRPRILDDDFATIIYTSGSTGKSKGIIQTHGNLVEGAEIISDYLNNVPGERVLSILPFSFDYGLNQLLTSLYSGFSLVLADYLFPLDILDLLKSEGITGVAGVPTIWVSLLDTLEKFPEIEFPDLRYITNSGGKLYPMTIRRLRKRLPSTSIYLMYGLTEAFRSTFLPPEEVDRRPESIGKSIPNVSIHVIDQQGRECGPGEVGELIHRGALISKGYWGDEMKSREVFRPNPLLPDKVRFAETVVYSGDLVRKDEEGYLYFVGRKDNMIKCQGHRVSPDEIAEALLRLEGVQDVAVVGVENERFGQRIVAFLQVGAESNITERTCKEFAKRILPPYMVPSKIQMVEKLPTNNNGKVDLVELKKRAIDAKPSI